MWLAQDAQIMPDVSLADAVCAARPVKKMSGAALRSTSSWTKLIRGRSSCEQFLEPHHAR
jgi:hypothetical protein